MGKYMKIQHAINKACAVELHEIGFIALVETEHHDAPPVTPLQTVTTVSDVRGGYATTQIQPPKHAELPQRNNSNDHVPSGNLT